MLTLEHQDGDIQYELEKGGFVVVNSKLHFSIETKAINEDSFPDCYLFALDGYPLSGSLESSRIEITTNPQDECPNVHVYTTFHASEVQASIELKVISGNEIEVALNVLSEDVNYYNEKAKPNLFKGVVKLYAKTLSEMWLP